jgi:Rod binding domain-containing protein
MTAALDPLGGFDPLGPARAAGLLDGTALPAGSLRTAASKDDDIRRTATEFEAVFLRQILASMLPEDGGSLFGGGPAGGTIRGMFVERIGNALAARRPLGVAELVEQTLRREASATDRPLVDLNA